MPTVPNPWLNLTIGNPFVASCDFPVINSRLSRIAGRVHLDLYPEPFMGDPDAEVYLLNGNPGYSDTDNCFAYPSSAMSRMLDVYSHKNRDFLWNDSSSPVQTLCPKSGRTIIHPGHGYWQKRLNQLTQQLKHNPRLFVLELYPYHSEKFYSFMRKPLPSFAYTKDLVNDAMTQNKIIIFLRHQKDWENVIPGLKAYPHVYTLNSGRNISLTPGNMPAAVWNGLLTKC